MIAIFKENDLMRAAVILARTSYHPILQFMRKGDKLEVIGSNAYVLISGEITATFENWDDGSSFKVCDSAGLKALARSLKHASSMPNNIEFDSELKLATVIVGSDKATTTFRFSNCNDNKPLELQESVHCSDEPEGSTLLDGQNICLIARLIKATGIQYGHWRIIPHGKNKPVCVKHEHPDCGISNLSIIAMPLREETE